MVIWVNYIAYQSGSLCSFLNMWENTHVTHAMTNVTLPPEYALTSRPFLDYDTLVIRVAQTHTNYMSLDLRADCKVINPLMPTGSTILGVLNGTIAILKWKIDPVFCFVMPCSHTSVLNQTSMLVCKDIKGMYSYCIHTSVIKERNLSNKNLG